MTQADSAGFARKLEDPRPKQHGLPTAALGAQTEPVMTGQPSALSEKVGPFYDAGGLSTWLGVSTQEIQARCQAGTIIGCLTAEGEITYPVWQFRDDGELLPGLPAILKVLKSGISDAWTWALWLQSAVPDELDGKTVTEWLREGGDVEPALGLAANDAAAWAT